MSAALMKAIGRRDEAEVAMVRVLEREYPVGAEVAWCRNGIHRGTVVMHSRGDRIKVKNERSGKELWIYCYSITS